MSYLLIDKKTYEETACENEEELERTVVQAKRQKRSIGLKAVQEVTAAKKYYRAHKTLVVINGTFTKNTKELAKSNYVELLNRTRLMKEIKKCVSFREQITIYQL